MEKIIWIKVIRTGLIVCVCWVGLVVVGTELIPEGSIGFVR